MTVNPIEIKPIFVAEAKLTVVPLQWDHEDKNEILSVRLAPTLLCQVFFSQISVSRISDNSYQNIGGYRAKIKRFCQSDTKVKIFNRHSRSLQFHFNDRARYPKSVYLSTHFTRARLQGTVGF